MADSSDIVQRVVVEVDDSQLAKIGPDAQRSFAELQRAAAFAGVSMEEFGRLSKHTQEQYIRLSAETAAAQTAVGTTAAGAAVGVKVLDAALDSTATRTGVSSREMRAFGKILREAGLGEIGGFAIGIGRVGSALGVLGVAAFAAVAAGAAIAKLTKDAAEAASEIRHLSDVSGNSFDKISNLQAAFEKAGVGAKEFGEAFSGVVRRIVEEAPKIGDAINSSVLKEIEAEIKLVKARAAARGGVPDPGVIANLERQANQAKLTAAEFELATAKANNLDTVLKQLTPPDPNWPRSLNDIGKAAKVTLDPLTSMKTVGEAVIIMLTRAGGSVKDLQGGLTGLDPNVNKVTDTLADLFQKLTPLQRVQLGEQLKLPPEVIESLSKGRAELEKLRAATADTAMTKEQSDKLKELGKSWNEFTAAAAASSRRIAASWAPTWVDLLSGAKKAAADLANLPIGENLLHSLQGVGAVLKKVFVDTWIEIGPQVISGLASLGSMIVQGWGAIAQAAATSFMQGFVQPIIDAFWFIVGAAKRVWNAIVQTAKDAWSAVSSFVMDYLVNPVVNAFKSFVKFCTDTWTTIKNGFIDAFNAILDPIKAVIDTITGWFTRLMAWAQKAWDTIRGAKAAAQGGPAEDAGGGLPSASGGLISGPGSATSDSIPAWLSAGEYVIRAAAVQTYGSSFFHALNNMTMPRFATGGLNTSIPRSVSSATPAMSGQRVFNLSIEGRSFQGMSIPERTAQSLERFAVNSQIASTGRKPSWRR